MKTLQDWTVEVGPHLMAVLIVLACVLAIIGLGLVWALGRRIAAWRAGAQPPPAPWKHGGGEGGGDGV